MPASIPTPSVVRVGERYYLVASTFVWFPGIPVFESRDLVQWTQVGSVIDRPGMLDFRGLGVSRGVFAPAIEHHDGTFYVFNTAVDNGGNFLVTATDPAGPWSDPVWLPGIDGIDPSLFVDEDGSAYLLNNGPPEGTPRYEGHRAIWMQAFDLTTKQPFGPRRMLVDGGVEPASNPIWIEGPHIFRRNGWYYLSCAEGGTGPQHSQVILRSREVWGPYQSYEHNPILTQRDLDPVREQPITNAGHGDLVQAVDGSWWMTFLASRTYGSGHYNTGRETFLLPVSWDDDWPHVLPPGTPIPTQVSAPSAMPDNVAQAPNSGTFSWQDDFDGPPLARQWLSLRGPADGFADLSAQPGKLLLSANDETLEGSATPAFVARRQQHLQFVAGTRLVVPMEQDVEAGLVAFQNERHWYFLGVRRQGAALQVFVEQRAGDTEARRIGSTSLPAVAELELVIDGDEGAYAFGYDHGDGLRWLLRDADGSILSTDVAGGFVGAMLGPHVRRVVEQGTAAENTPP